MTGKSAPNAQSTANPTFFHSLSDAENDGFGEQNLRRPIDNIRSAPRQSRLTRAEFENLLDAYYAGHTVPMDHAVRRGDHASIAGGRLVRKIAFTGSLALAVGLGIGLYSLSNQGSQTALGQSFNGFMAGFATLFSATDTSEKPVGLKHSSKLPPKTAPLQKKPIKTASVTVSDVSGTIRAGIPLKLVLTPKLAGNQVKINITNVPGDAVLTVGKRTKMGVWVLTPADLKNVALVLSSNRLKPLHLGVEVVETKTGELLTPIRQVKVAVLDRAPAKPRNF